MKENNIYDSIREMRELILIAKNTVSTLNVFIESFYSHYRKTISTSNESIYKVEKDLMEECYNNIRTFGLIFISSLQLPTPIYVLNHDESKMYNEIVKFETVFYNYQKEHSMIYEK